MNEFAFKKKYLKGFSFDDCLFWDWKHRKYQQVTLKNSSLKLKIPKFLNSAGFSCQFLVNLYKITRYLFFFLKILAYKLKIHELYVEL